MRKKYLIVSVGGCRSEEGYVREKGRFLVSTSLSHNLHRKDICCCHRDWHTNDLFIGRRRASLHN